MRKGRFGAHRRRFLAYPRYVPETGQVWVGSGVNAFWVVELDPRLRPESRGGRPPTAWSPKARSAGPPASYVSALRGITDRAPSAYYCNVLPT